ncbi:MAG: hypothetical protein KAU38_17005 [Desulfobacterales bacterium]|nr:hypothetical protein [Desulfobacterales bacterium]
MEDIREQPFFEVNDKAKYFDLLSEETPLKRGYNKLLKMKAGPERNALAKDLTRRMQPGSIDVNIMVKLDAISPDNNGNPLSDGKRNWGRTMPTIRHYNTKRQISCQIRC